ncbi:Putative PB1 domain, tetratricopeptide-like helical domain superfamily [Septoria linicola]|uniref:PB1 domain, tetratricopeptide-like helical domain superfamily n=1 Tax=Septoria linicola TaxID=215465 RepID=A0A9Q9ELW1_9PEZI|nr:Putative PB1 domain, tetratricopeptide-like helical domain superfamily [Septoria linicola]
MSLKQEIETWVTALAAYDNNEFDSAIKCFEQISDTSKILFNCGVIHATLGEHARAVECYQRAVQLDQYLAIAYFQQGVSNFLMGDFEEALANFNDTLLYLRGNNNIDYEQLGLKFKLYSCEVLFNRGLCYIYLQQKEAGMQDLIFATREKSAPDHDVIDEAIGEQAEGYTVFSIPVGIVYRPNEAKVKNLKAKDYLGRARLVAAQEYQNSDPRRAAALAAAGVDDRPGDKLSYAALNLVRPDLRSRAHRQQSEPPLRRDVFPPTPPPELERPDSAHGSHHRRKSTESTSSERSNLQAARPAAKALRLELGVAAFEQQKSPEKQRAAPKRAESERPAMRREYSGASARSSDSKRIEREHRSNYRDVPEVRIEPDPIEAYSEQVIQQQASSHQRTRSSAHRSQPVPIEEVEEDDVVSPSDAPLAFEIIPPRSVHQRHKSQSHRIPDMKKIRIKVHAEDMRYVMTTPTVTFSELSEQIKKKFGFRGTFKLKMKDEEGDLVTMADSDDLEMAIGICRAAAAKDKADMGKMEIFVQETL